MSKIYKIQDKKTGLYSTGGSYPSWTAKGKTWSSLGSLKSHIGLLMDSRPWRERDFANWEIVELATFESDRFTVLSAVSDLKEKRAKQEVAKKRRLERLAEKERQFEALKKELGR